MSVSCHSLEARREVLRPRYMDQDSDMYRAQRAQGGFPDFKALDLNVQSHDCSVYRERKHWPSQVLGDLSSRSQQDDSSPYSGKIAHKPRSSLDLISVDMRRPRSRKSKALGESPRIQKTQVEIPAYLVPSTPKPLQPIESSISPHRARGKAVIFNEEVHLDAILPSRYPNAAARQRGTLRRQLEDKLTGAPGNVDATGEFYHGREYIRVLPEKSRAGERQPSYVPAAPVIPRLPTPDLDPTSDYELGLAKYDFCPCCSSDDRDEDDSERWKNGKTKMDKQVDYARDYISRVSMRKPSIEEA